MSGKALNLSAIEAKKGESQGRVWFDSKYGGRFLLDLSASRAFLAKQDRVERFVRNRDGVKKGEKLSTLQAVEVVFRAYAGTYVVGWEQVNGENDQPIPFDETNFARVANACDGLFQTIAAFVNEREETLQEELKDLSGN